MSGGGGDGPDIGGQVGGPFGAGAGEVLTPITGVRGAWIVSTHLARLLIRGQGLVPAL